MAPSAPFIEKLIYTEKNIKGNVYRYIATMNESTKTRGRPQRKDYSAETICPTITENGKPRGRPRLSHSELELAERRRARQKARYERIKQAKGSIAAVIDYCPNCQACKMSV